MNQLINNLLNYEDVLFKNLFRQDTFFESIFKQIKYDYPIDIYLLDKNQLIIDIAAVDVDKEDITVEVKDNILKVNYNKKEDGNKRDITLIYNGITHRSFDFGWKILSNKLKLDKMEVTLDKGLLRIKIPVEQDKPNDYGFKKIVIK